MLSFADLKADFPHCDSLSLSHPLSTLQYLALTGEHDRCKCTADMDIAEVN